MTGFVPPHVPGLAVMVWPERGWGAATVGGEVEAGGVPVTTALGPLRTRAWPSALEAVTSTRRVRPTSSATGA